MKKNFLVLVILAITLTGCGYEIRVPKHIPNSFTKDKSTSDNYKCDNNEMDNGNKIYCSDLTSNYSNNVIYSVKVKFNNNTNKLKYEFSINGIDKFDMYDDMYMYMDILKILDEFVNIRGYFPSSTQFPGYLLFEDDYEGLLSVFNDVQSKF